jgi:hypothetical protein
MQRARADRGNPMPLCTGCLPFQQRGLRECCNSPGQAPLASLAPPPPAAPPATSPKAPPATMAQFGAPATSSAAPPATMAQFGEIAAMFGRLENAVTNAEAAAASITISAAKVANAVAALAAATRAAAAPPLNHASTLDDVSSTFMQAWPFVADWIKAHREAISKYVRALCEEQEEYLKEECFWALYNWRWHERTGVSSSSNSDHFSEGDTLLPQIGPGPPHFGGDDATEL